MSIKRLITLFLSVFTGWLFLTSSVYAQVRTAEVPEEELAKKPGYEYSGHIEWEGWEFDWGVWDYTGLALENVFYDNEHVIKKASLPIVRVKYGDQCHFIDYIGRMNLQPISNCDGKKVCSFTFPSVGGRRWLEIRIEATVYEYYIKQAWYLSEDGWILPRVFSKGVRCLDSHKHHPYWRLDFDIGDEYHPSDHVFIYENNNLRQYMYEVDDVKNPATNRAWVVRDTRNRHGVWILPAEGVEADLFSSMDIAVRVFHSSEDVSWPFFDPTEDLGYNEGELISETHESEAADIVIWYVGHLFHELPGDDDDEYRSIGPWLKIQRPIEFPGPGPPTPVSPLRFPDTVKNP